MGRFLGIVVAILVVTYLVVNGYIIDEVESIALEVWHNNR